MRVASKRIRLPAAVRRAVVAHARSSRPRECCGLLLGRDAEVRQAVPVANVARTPRTAYRVDDAAHIALRRDLRQRDSRLEIVGVYHSHPAGPAHPSPADIRQAYYPGWVHLIVGFAPRVQLRAFHIEDGLVTPMAIARPGAHGGRGARRTADR